MGGVDGTCGEDDLGLGGDGVVFRAALVGEACDVFAVECEALNVGVGDDAEVWAFEGGFEVGIGVGPAAAVFDGAAQGHDAFGIGAVEVLCQRPAHVGGGFEEVLGKRVHVFAQIRHK